MELPVDSDWKRSELLWFGVAGLLFAALLYLADIDQFIESLRQVDPWFFAVGLAVGFSSLLIWAWVWHRFFGKMDIESSRRNTAKMFMSGHFLNSITPLGQFGGEPILAYIISDNTDTGYEKALTCVVSSDLLNATPFFTFTLGGIIYLFFFGSLEGFLVEVAIMSLILLVLLGLLAYILWFKNEKVTWIANTALSFLEKRVSRGEKFFESAQESIKRIEQSFKEAGQDPVFLLKTVVISHLAIMAQILSLYFVLLSLGIEPGFVSIYFIVNLSAIATLSPTPGGSGTYEAAFSGIMTFFYPVQFATALTAAILFRLTTYWPGLIVGYFCLISMRTSGLREKIRGKQD